MKIESSLAPIESSRCNSRGVLWESSLKELLKLLGVSALTIFILVPKEFSRFELP